MTKIVTRKELGAPRNRWPLGRGVAAYMRPEIARRHLDAGVRLGDRLIALGAVARKVLHDLFAPLDLDAPRRERCTETAATPTEPDIRKAA